MTESKWWNNIHFCMNSSLKRDLSSHECPKNIAQSLWTWKTRTQTGGPLFHFTWCVPVSISKKQPLVWANVFSEVLPNSACLMKYWEELCGARGYLSRQDRSSCCDRCSTPDPVTDPWESHTAHAFHQRYLWQQPQGGKDTCRRPLSASSAAVWCVRLLWLSGVFLMHTDLCAAAALSIYEVFKDPLQRVFVFIRENYNWSSLNTEILWHSSGKNEISI